MRYILKTPIARRRNRRVASGRQAPEPAQRACRLDPGSHRPTAARWSSTAILRARTSPASESRIAASSSSRQRSALARQLIALYCREHARRLLTAHHRDPRVGPHPEPARLVRAAAHAVVASAERAADHDGELGHDAVGHSMHQLGAVSCDSGAFVLPPDDEAGDVLQEHQRHAALVAELDEMRAP